jgi:hypothetical protein
MTSNSRLIAQNIGIRRNNFVYFDNKSNAKNGDKNTIKNVIVYSFPNELMESTHLVKQEVFMLASENSSPNLGTTNRIQNIMTADVNANNMTGYVSALRTLFLTADAEINRSTVLSMIAGNFPVFSAISIDLIENLSKQNSK